MSRRHSDVAALARHWLDAWNHRDLEGILSHYAPGVRFQAQTAADRWGAPDGWLVGTDALRRHFARGLEMSPSLRFRERSLLIGPNGYLLVYDRSDGNVAADAVDLDRDGLAHRVRVYYQRPQR